MTTCPAAENGLFVVVFLNLCNFFFYPIPDRGIIMTFGSGSNGCLGHGNFNDVTQVDVTLFTRQHSVLYTWTFIDSKSLKVEGGKPLLFSGSFRF